MIIDSDNMRDEIKGGYIRMLQLQCPSDNSKFSCMIKFDDRNMDCVDWGYEFEHAQNYRHIGITICAFAENVPSNGLALRLAIGSKNINGQMDFSEQYMLFHNGINYFLFNSEEMTREHPTDLKRIRQIYFGGYGKQGTIYFNISAPGIDGVKPYTLDIQEKGNMIGRINEDQLSYDICTALKSTWRDIGSCIHRARDAEIKRTFCHCKSKCFNNGLEIGAGDCYQSKRIAPFVKKYLCTDLNESGFPKEYNDDITYSVLDAEKLKESFQPEIFDFVYSSSLLEHLPSPQKAIDGVYYVLQNGGVFVCLLPNPLWRVLNTLFWPYSQHKYSIRYKRLKQVYVNWHQPADYNNNIKLPNSKKIRRFGPPPHGVSETRWKELFAFSARRWKKLFKEAGFTVVRVRRGPVSSGLGLGHEMVKRIMEFLGFGTMNIYILAKKDAELANRYFSI